MASTGSPAKGPAPTTPGRPAASVDPASPREPDSELSQLENLQRQSEKDVVHNEQVRVVARVRPFNDRERAIAGNASVVRMNAKAKLAYITPPYKPGEEPQTKPYPFDDVFWSMDGNDFGGNPPAGQEDIFKRIGEPLVRHAFEGYNSCLLAYGQTGSGKTYSMMGPSAVGNQEVPEGQVGLIPRICNAVFQTLAQPTDPDLIWTVQVGYLEIYNDEARDLLTPSKPKGATKLEPTTVRIREGTEPGKRTTIVFAGNAKETVASLEDIRQVIRKGDKLRAAAETEMNERSSRSHAIFQVFLESKRKGENGEPPTPDKKAMISLVDLAGSERIDRSGVTGARLTEATEINKSLSTLAKVIDALVARSNQRSTQATVFIPYRDSALTWLLKDSLGGNSKTYFLATLSPSADNYQETLSTLNYVSKAQKIVNIVKQNEDKTSRMIRLLKEHIHSMNANAGDSALEMYRSRCEQLQAQLREQESQRMLNETQLKLARTEEAQARAALQKTQEALETEKSEWALRAEVREKEFLRLKEEQAAALERARAAAEKTVVTLEEERKAKERALREAARSKEDLERKLSETQTRVAELEFYLKRRDDEMQALIEKTNRLDEVQSAHAEVQRERDMLKEKEENSRQQMTFAVESAKKDLEYKDQTIADLQEILGSRTDELRKAKLSFADLQEQHAKDNQRRAEEYQKVVQLLEDQKSATARKDEELVELNKALSAAAESHLSAMEKVQHQMQELQRLRDTDASTATRRLEETIVGKTREAEEKERQFKAELESLANKLAASQEVSRTNELKYQSMVKELEIQLEAAQVEAAQAKQSKVSIHEELEEQIKALRDKLNSSESQCRAEKESVTVVRAELVSVQNKFKGELQIRESEKEQLANQLAESKAEAKALRSEANEQRKEVERLELANQALDAQFSALRVELDLSKRTTTSKIASLESQLTEKDKAIEGLRETLREKEIELSQVRTEQMTRLNSIDSHAKDDLAELEEKLNNAFKDLTDLQRKLEETSRRYENSVVRGEGLMQDKLNLESSVGKLQADLQVAQELRVKEEATRTQLQTELSAEKAKAVALAEDHRSALETLRKEKDNDIGDLRMAKLEVENRCENLLAELQRRREEIGDLLDLNGNLKQQIATNNVTLGEVKELRRCLEVEKERSSRAQSTLDEVTKRWEAQGKQEAERWQSWKSQKEIEWNAQEIQLREQIRKREDELIAAKEQHHNAVTELRDLVVTTEGKLKSEKIRWEDQLKKLEQAHDHARAQWQSQLEQVRGEVQIAADRLETERRQAAEAEKALKEKLSLEGAKAEKALGEVTDLQKQLEDLSKRADARRKQAIEEVQKLSLDRDNLRREQARLLARQAESEADLAAAFRQVETLELDAKSLRLVIQEGSKEQERLRNYLKNIKGNIIFVEDLFQAATQGSVSGCRRYVEEDGAAVTSIDASGRTPLHWAAENGHRDVCSYLIQIGADVNAKSKDGVRPLTLAKGGNHQEVVKLLLRNKAVE